MDQIKNILKQKGLTQKEFAEKLGTSLQNVKQLINKDTVKLSTLQTWAKVLNVPVADLINSTKKDQTVSSIFFASVYDDGNIKTYTDKDELIKDFTKEYC